MNSGPTHTHLSLSAALLVLVGCGADGGAADSQAPDEQANILFSECTPNPCGNGGSCADTLLSFECSCVGGYTGTLCEVAPTQSPVTPPALFPPLFPVDHTLQLSVQQTLSHIVSKPENLLGVTVSVNGQACAGGSCSVPVAAGASATVDVTVKIAKDTELPVLQAWDGCTQTPGTFEHKAFDDGSNTLRWTTTFANLDADKSCSANFAHAAFFWFHLPAFGPSIAQGQPAQFCDYAVDPIYVPQLPAGQESWSTSCVVPPGTTVTLTPIYKGRQLDSMVCYRRSSASDESTRMLFTSTPAVITETRSGQLYDCALDKLPE